MLKYGYVAKWKNRVTVGFALFFVVGAFVAPIFVDEPIAKMPAFFFLLFAFMAMAISQSPDMMGGGAPGAGRVL